jgi:hypothetical protein
MRRSQRPARKFAGLFISLVVAAACSGISREDSAQLAKIRNDLQTGFSNGGWNLDRYPELEPLKAGARITVADLPGPGIIRHIHTTRHRPAEVFARGIVLEIWFDDADSPAVMSPLADFFGDGCNGRSMDFSAELIECAPWSYNCYFVMPFKERARVFLMGRDMWVFPCDLSEDSLPLARRHFRVVFRSDRSRTSPRPAVQCGYR